MDMVSYLLGKNASGGSSSGGIEESGSNEYGNYIKYTDGTIIQWGKDFIDNVSFTQFTSGINYSAAQTITLPVECADASLVSSSVMSRTKNLSWTINVVSTTTAITFYVVNSSTTATKVEYEWLSIGTWK